MKNAKIESEAAFLLHIGIFTTFAENNYVIFIRFEQQTKFVKISGFK